MAVINISDNDYQEKVLNASVPVVVDFWAEWCGPCKMIAPTLEALATKYGDKIIIAKMNVDNNPKIPSQVGVRGIPMLILVKEGAVVSTKVGALPQDQLEAWIDSYI